MNNGNIEKMSPFAFYMGERKITDAIIPKGMVALENKISRNDLGNLETQIVLWVVRLGFVTASMITKLLSHQVKEGEITDPNEVKWVNNITPKKINNKNKALVQDGLLSAFSFGGFESKSGYKVYVPGINALKYLQNLKEQGILSDIYVEEASTYAAVMCVEQIKAHLATNQIEIAFRTRSKNFLECATSRITVLSAASEIRAKVLKLGKNTPQTKKVILEGLRRGPKWKAVFSERFEIFSKFFENFESGQAGFTEIPALLIICEDMLHIKEVIAELVGSGRQIPSNIFFTYDVLAVEECSELATSWFSFKMEDEKPVLTRNKIEILS